MYSMNTNEVEIVDHGFVISVINKQTGERAVAKNRCGYVDHKMSFALSYSGKPQGVAVIASGRPEALNECLRLVGLPSYRTLKKHEAQSIDNIIRSATAHASESKPSSQSRTCKPELEI